MYRAVDVAYYITNYSAENNNEISHLKLQKLLYFVQAFFLTCTLRHKPCFRDEIEAWGHGPVVPEVYEEFKSFGSSPICRVHEYLIPNGENVWVLNSKKFNKKEFRYIDRKRIESVVDNFKDCSAFDLEELTHSQDPWIDAYKRERTA